MKPYLIAFCTASLICSVTAMAQAQTPSEVSLHDRLTLGDGMTEVSTGLYERTTDGGSTFIAVGRSGHEALLERMIDYRAGLGAPFLPEDPNSVHYLIDDAIDDLRSSVSTKDVNDEDDGSCSGSSGNGTGPFHVEAHAGGIVGPNFGASALAQNTNGSLNTANYAYSKLTNRLGSTQASQTTTTAGTTAAIAASYVPVAQACLAESYASIKCPGVSSPAISAAAFYHVPSCVLP